MGGLYGILLESGAMCFFLLSLNKSPFLKEGSRKGEGILYHLRNIYQQGELDKGATCKENLRVQTEAGRLVRHAQPIYNLDVIISVFIGQKSIESLSEVMRVTRIVDQKSNSNDSIDRFHFCGLHLDDKNNRVCLMVSGKRADKR